MKQETPLLMIDAVKWLKNKAEQEVKGLSEIFKPLRGIYSLEKQKYEMPPLRKETRIRIKNLQERIKACDGFLKNPKEYIRRLLQLPQWREEIKFTSCYLKKLETKKIKRMSPKMRQITCYPAIGKRRTLTEGGT